MLLDKKSRFKCELKKLMDKFPNSSEERHNSQIIDQFIDQYYKEDISLSENRECSKVECSDFQQQVNLNLEAEIKSQKFDILKPLI